MDKVLRYDSRPTVPSASSSTGPPVPLDVQLAGPLAGHSLPPSLITDPLFYNNLQSHCQYSTSGTCTSFSHLADEDRRSEASHSTPIKGVDLSKGALNLKRHIVCANRKKWVFYRLLAKRLEAQKSAAKQTKRIDNMSEEYKEVQKQLIRKLKPQVSSSILSFARSAADDEARLLRPNSYDGDGDAQSTKRVRDNHCSASVSEDTTGSLQDLLHSMVDNKRHVIIVHISPSMEEFLDDLNEELTKMAIEVISCQHGTLCFVKLQNKTVTKWESTLTSKVQESLIPEVLRNIKLMKKDISKSRDKQTDKQQDLTDALRVAFDLNPDVVTLFSHAAPAYPEQRSACMTLVGDLCHWQQPDEQDKNGVEARAPVQFQFVSFTHSLESDCSVEFFRELCKTAARAISGYINALSRVQKERLTNNDELDIHDIEDEVMKRSFNLTERTPLWKEIMVTVNRARHLRTEMQKRNRIEENKKGLLQDIPIWREKLHMELAIGKLIKQDSGNCTTAFMRPVEGHAALAPGKSKVTSKKGNRRKKAVLGTSSSPSRTRPNLTVEEDASAMTSCSDGNMQSKRASVVEEPRPPLQQSTIVVSPSTASTAAATNLRQSSLATTSESSVISKHLVSNAKDGESFPKLEQLPTKKPSTEEDKSRRHDGLSSTIIQLDRKF
eukprot:GHVQ01004647.1.p1 GENE.GHVQ01004647.1~~GHVQ01004647.1.p1  ORF type:complete len:666 (+),score=76.15 GHVQ01004647.1:40-2037(+)